MKEENSEEPISNGTSGTGLPLLFKIFSSIIAAVVLIPSFLLIKAYLDCPETYASPSDIGLNNLLIVGLTILLLTWLPWEKVGLKIKKIGIVEFDEVMSGQAEEHAEEFAELRARIQELESYTKGLDEVSSISDSTAIYDFTPLLNKFLRERKPKAFSPLKIRSIAIGIPEYQQLANSPQQSIRVALQNMVAQGKVSTRVSRMGNTLYKINDEEL